MKAITRVITPFTVAVFLFVGTSCSTSKKISMGPEPAPGVQAPRPAPMGPEESFGPPMPEAPPTVGPQPILTRSVVLVFGPGLARGFAFVGAIRALHEARISIGAVLGTEMGALIGAVYASEADINRFEWAIQRFKDEVFFEKSSLISRLLEKPGDGKKLSDELEKFFGDRDLNSAKVPLRIALQPEEASDPLILKQGKAAPALRAAMAVPGLMTVSDWQGGMSMAADSSRPYLVSEARALNLGPVIVVDVLTDPDKGKNRIIEVQMAAAENLGTSELRLADLVIRPNMKGIGYLDFDKRTDAAFRGKSAISGKISEIRKLVSNP